MNTKTLERDVFTLPDLGEGLMEAEIVGWHVSEGDHVVTDQPLLAVETDKAVVEVPSPHSGRIAKLCAAVGDVVPIGAPLVEFEVGAPADTGTVVGEIQPAETPRKRVRAAPAVRRLAGELGVDLDAVAATGPGGTITSEDVTRAAEDTTGPPGRIERLRGVRRAMAINMAAADAVRATVTEVADVEAWTEGQDVTFRLVRAIARAAAAEPALNAWFDGERLERRLHDHVHLGIAVDTPDGLFVPVLRDVGNRDAKDLRRGLTRMKRAIRERSIPPEALRGQTITLSNFGMIAGRHSTMVLIRPQVAIVGAGRLAPEVVVVDGRPAVHRRIPLSLTFDHRAVAGGEAGRFLNALIADLELAD